MVLSTFTSGSTDGSGFNIDIVFNGSGWTDELQQAFFDSANYLSSIIVGDLADFSGGLDGVNQTIDDIKITAELVAGDGVGGNLGGGGPVYLRVPEYLPITGSMTFDTADTSNMLADLTWDDVILHEMLHVLGIGTLWETKGLITNLGTTSAPEYRYTGENANHEYKTEFNSLYRADTLASSGVPVESDQGGSGTLGSHWDESTFGTEVMTGFMNTGAYVSNMTIAALQDLGYQTTYLRTAACYTRNCHIETTEGEVPVALIKVGTKVITRDHGVQEVIWVGKGDIDAAYFQAEQGRLPVRIKPHQFGKNLPSRPTTVSALHRVLVQPENLSDPYYVKAKHLTIISGVSQAKSASINGACYYHLLLKQHSTIKVNGMWMESLYLGEGASVYFSDQQIAEMAASLGNQHGWLDENGEPSLTNHPEIGKANFERLFKREALAIA